MLEGLQSLEHAGLLLKRNFGSSGGTTYALTRAGEAALTDGTVRQLLG